MNHTTGRPASLKFAVSLALIGALGPSAVDMYLASLPEMAEDFSTHYANVQWTLMVFLLAMGIGQLLFGPLIDAVGRYRPLLVGLLLFVASALAASLAPSLETLLLARFVQGLGSALTLVVIMSMVRDVAQGTQAAKLFALLMTIEGLAPIIAPAIGGFIDQHFGWRAVMLVLAGMSVLVLLNTCSSLSETLPQARRLPFNLGGALGSYRRIAADGQFLRPALAISAVFFFLFAYIGGSAFVYQQHYGMSSASFGLLFGATGVAIMLGAITAGRLVERWGLARLAWLGACCLFLGALLALLGELAELGLQALVAGLAVAMFGLGLCEATLMSLAMGSQSRALGATAALLGAMQLSIASTATPLAGYLVGFGAGHWTAALLITAALVMLLTRASIRHAPVTASGLAGH